MPQPTRITPEDIVECGVRLLSERGADDIVLFGGGIVPEEDLERLLEKGVGAIFTPGAQLEDIVAWIRANVKPRSLEG